MFKNYTYEYILKSILDRITTADPTIDIREGSPIWYAVSPVALELAIAYTNFDALSKESFVGTATREGIYRACRDIGLNTEQFDASAGIFLAHFDGEVTIGSRWSCGNYIFVVESKEGMVKINDVDYHQYRLRCETLGSHTRHTAGHLTVITDYGSNIVRVSVLDECIVVGADETKDEDVRTAYFDYVATKTEGANVAQYHQWLSEFDGIGAQRVLPTFNGENTVGIMILDELMEAPTSELVASVQEYLDPNAEGLGEGKAPIGAKVTVMGGVNAYIDVKADFNTTSIDADISDINERLTNYFREIAFEKSVVNIYEVASRILSSPTVSSINDVQIRKWAGGASKPYSASNVTLAYEETPVLHEFVKA